MFAQANPEVEADDGDADCQGGEAAMSGILPVVERRTEQRGAIGIEGGCAADSTGEDAAAKEGEDKTTQGSGKGGVFAAPSQVNIQGDIGNACDNQREGVCPGCGR